MRLLIDSHALIWWFEGSTYLSAAANHAIAASDVLVSAAGLLELTIKASSGKLALPAPLETMVVDEGFSVLPIDFNHLRRLETLPRLHRDPFDRMMIAQALAEGIPIATRDRVFAAYGVQIVW
ncbi:MAG TPA: type II toxin-antitoxin system VapC family toxin [Stellaceae bacterium]|nr:type II toxin-antitoxin system VapC family toxin [Stellaceae bacterium]